jgi:opacity protein-like surface antigen
MKRVVAIAFAGIVATSATAQAADLLGPEAPAPVFGQPTEILSGWYLRGDVGYSQSNTPTIIPQGDVLPVPYTDAATGVPVVYPPLGHATQNLSPIRGNNEDARFASFNVGVGYRFTDNFRMDATYTYWTGAAYSYKQSTLCPGSYPTPVSNTVLVGGVPTPQPVGYLWAPTGCEGFVSGHQYNQTGLVNAYYDIGSYWGITPYVGGGLGMNANVISGGSQFYNLNDGSAYAGNTSVGGAPLKWVAQTGSLNGQPVYSPLASQYVTFGPQNWNRNISATKYNFAWALMGGLSYQISHNLYLDLGYRYLSAPIGSLANNMQEVHLGVRLVAY